MKCFFLLFLIAVFPRHSWAQTTPFPQYNEANYVQQEQGLDPASNNELYAIWYRHVQNPALVLKKSFVDGSYSKLLSKAFYSENTRSGPFYGYTDGVLTYQAFYKFGKLDGEALTYNEGKITQRAHYVEGVKTGVWEEFSLEGKPIRKITYDQKGHMVSVENVIAN